MPRQQPQRPQPELVHPLYVDVPMLISFLATLRGGISYSSEVAETPSAAHGRRRRDPVTLGYQALRGS